jgi:acyl-coenzyme A thioesterase PaaI-like protein
MKFNPVAFAKRIPIPILSKSVMNTFLNFGIPFNAGLGLSIQELSPERVAVKMPSRWKRKNHLGGAHACAIALLCEVPAGLLILQKYPADKYRFILGGLTVNYHKQGRGPIFGEVSAPAEWPLIVDNGEIWVEFETKVTNTKGEVIADGKTKWQIKPWSRVRKGSAPTT